MCKILVVNNDSGIDPQVAWVTECGYTVEVTNSSIHLITQRFADNHDLIVLQARTWAALKSWIEFYRKSGGAVPIIAIIAASSREEQLSALDCGVDKLLVWPLETDELSAWIRRILKRPVSNAAKVIQKGSIILDVDARCVIRHGTKISLRQMEFNLLEFMIKHPDQIFSAEALFTRVWDTNSNGRTSGVSTVRTHIKTLRRRLAEFGVSSLVNTVAGSGYTIGVPGSDF